MAYIDFKKWHAATNGAGRRSWFICRPRLNHNGCDTATEYLCTSSGALLRFASQTSAQKRADDMNLRDRE